MLTGSFINKLFLAAIMFPLKTYLIILLCSNCFVNARVYFEGDIRLIGGQRRYMGTVAIFHDGKWGAICDSEWDKVDAAVTCRQLGYPGVVKASVKSEFGMGTRRIWLSNVQCTGNELRLADCPSAGYNIYTRDMCPGMSRSAGVICSAAIVKGGKESKKMNNKTKVKKSKLSVSSVRTINISESSPRVTTSQISTITSKTILTNDSRVSDTVFDSYTTDTSTLSHALFTTTVNSKVTEHILSSATTDNVTLSVTESTFLLPESTIISTEQNHTSNITSTEEKQVKIDEIFSELENKSHTFNATHFIQNIQEQKLENKTNESLQLPADAPQEQFFLEIRLQGGRYKWEGHLQVRTGDEPWTTICADFWTLRESMVACNQLKDLGKAKQALLTSYFGGSDIKKGYYRIQCSGRESTLGECRLTKTDATHICSKKSSVAGIVCSNYLPDLVPNLRAVEDSVRLQDQPLYYLRCSMEENCLSNSAYVIYNTSNVWRSNLRRLLRFSTIVHNRGNADFKPYLPRGQWQWHACHMHYHSMEIFAHYDIIDRNGNRLAQGSKASFCLEDSACDQGVHPQFNCKGYAEQGLSVNCSDNYMYDIDCQWIDITDIKPGEYTFLIEINPDMLVAESNFDNNIVSCRLYYNGFFASLRQCHFESLLDFRKP